MLKLTDPVAVIPKIGPAYQKSLEKLTIFTVEDLLMHVPFRYEDYSQVLSISTAKETANTQTTEQNEQNTKTAKITTKGMILEIKNIYTKNGKRLTKAIAADETGEIDIIWFNQQYLAKTIKKGKKYYFSGKVQKFGSKTTLVAPEYELAENEKGRIQINTGRLVPIYNETQGITSKWLRTRINDVLDAFTKQGGLQEFIPQKILEKQNLIAFEDAVNNVHFPLNQAQIPYAKKRLAFGELLVEMLKVEKRKKIWNTQYEGIHLDYEKFKDKIATFVHSLPFSLTSAQKQAVDEILHDLAQSHPMNRLLEGDVGSGKTIVAVIAAYLCHLNGYKTVYMAPTEILAKQHFDTFTKFLMPFNLSLRAITGSENRANKKTGGKTIKVSGKDEDNAVFDSRTATTNSSTGSSANTNEILIGTHALLFEKELIENVGLVIIDEQHRFGVEQREQIVQMGTKNKKPNLLTMTATPIPRTLALTLYGDLDISVLDTVPNPDKKVTTRVVPESLRAKTYQWIKAQRRQTFVVCPLIEDSESEAFENVKAAQTEFETLKNGIFADVPIGLLHGRMRTKEKQTVMDDFRTGRLMVLVSTPVIEVGVDVPSAAVMVIESGERYGLASLHQLRGRVGRGATEGFCFVFMSNNSRTGYARLKNLERINNGLRLAEIDMQYRGQGDIFGILQHGFKSFKVANLSDSHMLEQAKLTAQELFGELDKYKALKELVESKTSDLVGRH